MNGWTTYNIAPHGTAGVAELSNIDAARSLRGHRELACHGAGNNSKAVVR